MVELLEEATIGDTVEELGETTGGLGVKPLGVDVGATGITTEDPEDPSVIVLDEFHF